MPAVEQPYRYSALLCLRAVHSLGWTDGALGLACGPVSSLPLASYCCCCLCSCCTGWHVQHLAKSTSPPHWQNEISGSAQAAQQSSRLTCLLPTASSVAAASRTTSLAPSRAMRASASFSRKAPCPAMGRPKAVRCWARRAMSWMARCPMPAHSWLGEMQALVLLHVLSVDARL